MDHGKPVQHRRGEESTAGGCEGGQAPPSHGTPARTDRNSSCPSRYEPPTCERIGSCESAYTLPLSRLKIRGDRALRKDRLRRICFASYNTCEPAVQPDGATTTFQHIYSTPERSQSGGTNWHEQSCSSRNLARGTQPGAAETSGTAALRIVRSEGRAVVRLCNGAD